MPTFDRGPFLPRAIGSLLRQSVSDWELLVIDDGSRDRTATVVAGYLDDPRISYERWGRNRGLGAAANRGLDRANAPLVAYLPADDLYDPDHLAALLACFTDDESHDAVVLAWAGMRHRGAATTLDPLPGYDLQLVQVMHRLTGDRWLERRELESDDLDRLFWAEIRRQGRGVGTGRVTCEWVDHPDQRHKHIRETHDGGLNVFRTRYHVAAPLRFHSTDSGNVDEPGLYRRFRERPATPPAADGLRILLVGELAFNPERILALEERGHRLFGLWTPDGLGDSTVGPLPFGHVEDLPRRDWRQAIHRLRPDLVYALLNWRAVPFAHAVLDAGLGIPFVWHFKESPMRCITRGTWGQLVDLMTRSDAQVYATPEEREWFLAAVPGLDHPRSLVLDGDLPKRDWFRGQPGERRRADDGQVHTVVLGRPHGLDPQLVATLAGAGIHTHLYGLVRAPGPKGAWTGWLEEARRLAPRHLHIHPHLDQRSWLRELSRYDAGWLHRIRSHNRGDLAAASWDDLNYPARMAPMVACGVPLLQQHSPGCVVAAQNLVGCLGVGVLYDRAEDLCEHLHDRAGMERRRRACLTHRDQFTFDHHVDRLVELFRTVIR